MNFLFRYPPESHTFITTEDPEYKYEVLCGYCEYPLEKIDDKCPRCQQDLEDCPVCGAERHRKSLRTEIDPVTGGRTCSVCGVTRISFGERRISDLRGSFCTNIYGCPAGGLLLRTEEFAILPHDATLCPICRSADLPPADVRTFTHLLNSCWFCNTCFGAPDFWRRGWSTAGNPNLEKVREALRTTADPPCRLCGRNDQRVDVEARKGDGGPDSDIHIQSFSIDTEGRTQTNVLSESEYIRVAELGRILILEPDDVAAFGKAFDAWFSSAFKSQGRITVRQVVDELLAGTLYPVQHRILQRRLERFLHAWERKLPRGLDHRIPDESRSEAR